MNIYDMSLLELLIIREKYANELNLTNSSLCNSYSKKEQEILQQRAIRIQKMIEKITIEILQCEKEFLREDE